MTDITCSEYNSACVANTDGSGCVKKKSLCTDYSTPQECIKTTSNVKCYYGASCVAITDSTCGTVVKGSGAALTDVVC